MPLPERDIREHGALVGSDPSNRLVLFYIPVLDGAGWDFHELVWFRLGSGAWQSVVIITAEQFQRGSNLRRWVSKLHSFNSDSGSAVVQVGEVDSPDPRNHGVLYTWRSLHLPTLELRTLQHCSDPFDSYAGG